MELILFKKTLYEVTTLTPAHIPLLEGYQRAQTVIVEHLDDLTLDQSLQLPPSQWNKTFGLWEVRRLNGLGEKEYKTPQTLYEDYQHQNMALEGTHNRTYTYKNLLRAKHIARKMESSGVLFDREKANLLLTKASENGEEACVKKLISESHPNGTLHTHWLFENNSCGRISNDGYMQSLKRKGIARSCIHSPFYTVNKGTKEKPRETKAPGKLLLLDYSQCHVQIFANENPGSEVSFLLAQGNDLYEHLAQYLNFKKHHPTLSAQQTRVLLKVLTLMMLNGGTREGILNETKNHGILLQEGQAQSLYSRLHSFMPELNEFHTRSIDLYEKGELITPGGRKISLLVENKYTLVPPIVAAKYPPKIYATYFQATESEILNTCFVLCNKKRKLDAGEEVALHPLLPLHDGILFSVRADLLDEAASVLKEQFIIAFKDTYPDSHPQVTVEVGDNFGEMSKYKK